MFKKITKEQLNGIKEIYPKGVIVKLVNSSDKKMISNINKKMLVSFVDSIGRLHGKWENGSFFAINLKTDKVKIVRYYN